MARKKNDPYEQQRQRRYTAHGQSPQLHEQYPQVKELVIHMSFEDPDWHSDPENREEIFRKEYKAFFEFECPYVECINGGFDLSSEVNGMIQDCLGEMSGSVTCQGWQDRERVNKHRCHLKMIYIITAKYVVNAE